MTALESTPEFATAVYERMQRTLEVVRQRLGRPLGLADKLLLAHLDDPLASAAMSLSPLSSGGEGGQGGEVRSQRSYVQLRPDRVLLQDVLGQTAMLQFVQTRRTRTAVPTTIHCDHLIQARAFGESDLRESLAENDEVYQFLRTAAAKFGVGFWEPGAGIIHQVTLEHYAFPGQLIVGTDSHTPNAGGLGACAVGVGGADAVEVMAGLPWEVLYPTSVGVRLTGELSGWAAPKDVILELASRLTVSGATNAIIEYFGPGTRSISATGKATICNMGAELGATTSIFPYDQRMATYLAATGRSELAALADRHVRLLVADPEVERAPLEHFDRLVEIDLARLEPHVAGPHSPDVVRPLSRLAAELLESGNHYVDAISTALIGSCTNSSYEDMSRAADVARQARAHGIQSAVPLMVTPGSEQIRATIERDGQLAALEAMGATVLANACGPCIGQWRRAQTVASQPNTILTSYNRNFPMRNDGQPTTMNFIASPEIVTALALAGTLAFDPRRDPLTGASGETFYLVPPGPAPEVPSTGYAAGRQVYTAPPLDGTSIELTVDPDSERLQLMHPWPAWDGHDFVDLPILLKTLGKTTTDDIAPAGPWLRYRGNLEKFSDNMFLGATSAFTGERARSIAQSAKHFRAEGQRWAVVGDWNYGEGSSREHAALSPRLLGGVAIIARSFARIHESNLKKQGILALTFSDPTDYDRIREHDRLSLVGLAELAEGRPVQCVIVHADAAREQLWLQHSYAASQLDWFRRGSALNLVQ
ncbi:MAG TPA: aconitate hydratase [Chloroflexota bacterium]|nr:aconitate hydratase [Chloroflexota bacterium]